MYNAFSTSYQLMSSTSSLLPPDTYSQDVSASKPHLIGKSNAVFTISFLLKFISDKYSPSFNRLLDNLLIFLAMEFLLDVFCFVTFFSISCPISSSIITSTSGSNNSYSPAVVFTTTLSVFGKFPILLTTVPTSLPSAFLNGEPSSRSLAIIETVVASVGLPATLGLADGEPITPTLPLDSCLPFSIFFFVLEAVDFAKSFVLSYALPIAFAVPPRL